MNFPDAIKALMSLAEDNNVLVSKAKTRKVLTGALRANPKASMDDVYLYLSNAFLADRTLFADHEQLSAQGSVVNEVAARETRDERDAELHARLVEKFGEARADKIIGEARAEWDTAHPAGFMAPNDSSRLGRNES